MITLQQILNESSLDQLYDSAVEAFPRTTKRQHSIDPVEIVEVKFTPFVGMKTLMARGLAHSGPKEYNTVVVFKGVDYKDEGGRHMAKLTVEGVDYLFERLSAADTDVLVRCNCPDFHWRFKHWNYLDKSLQGRNRRKYEAKYSPGSSNPLELPGMCKHLLKFARVLGETPIIE